jgi:hypothetical protein
MGGTQIVRHAIALPEAPARTVPARRERGTVAMALLGTLALGFAVRVFVLRSSLGQLNSDEATTGLMAVQVLRGQFPLLVAGNNYGGTFEAFLLAPLLVVAGPSSLLVKSVPILTWLLASVVLYRIAAPLVGRRRAALLGGVLWVFSSSMVVLSTRAYSGYGSGIVACLLALLLLLQELEPDPGDHVLRRRLLLGFVTGFALWQHPMYLAMLLPAHAYVALRSWRAPVGFVAPLAVGTAVGLLPMLVYNVGNRWASLHVFPQPPSTYGSRLLGFVVALLPRLLGLEAANGAWTGGGLGQTLFLVLLLLFVLAVSTLLRGSPQERLIGTVAIVAPFLTAAFPTSWFYLDARYGVYYAPIILLVVGLALQRRLPDLRVPAAALFAVPFLSFSLFCFPSLHQVALPPASGTPDGDVERLADALAAAGVDRVRADYWIAYRLTFLTDARIVATAFEPIRFPEYERLVLERGEDVGYVAFAGDSRDASLASSLPGHARQQVAQYALYLPQETR